MESIRLKLSVLPDRFAVCQLDRDASPPSWSTSGAFFSISRTPEELSIVCPEAEVPVGVRAEKDWRALKVEGPLDFSLTGILAALATPLAAAGISIFALSTYDTDYILVKADRLDSAVKVLSAFCSIAQ